MGNNCAPFLCDMFLYCFEAHFMHRLLKRKTKRSYPVLYLHIPLYRYLFHCIIKNKRQRITKGQSKMNRETGNIGYTIRRRTKQKHNTICVGHHYTQINTNNVNKTWALLQTTRGKDEPNIVCMRKS